MSAAGPHVPKARAPKGKFVGVGYAYAVVASCPADPSPHRHVRVRGQAERVCEHAASWCESCGTPHGDPASLASCHGCAHLAVTAGPATITVTDEGRRHAERA